MRLRVEQQGIGPQGTRVELDGEDVSDAIRALAVEMDTGTAFPTVMLAPLIQDLTVELDEPQIYISPAARHLLVKLGWIPPLAESGTE